MQALDVATKFENLNILKFASETMALKKFTRAYLFQIALEIM